MSVKVSPRFRIINQLKEEIWGAPTSIFHRFRGRKWWFLKGKYGRKRLDAARHEFGYSLNNKADESLLHIRRQNRPPKKGVPAMFGARLKAKRGLQLYYGKMRSHQLLSYYQKSEFQNAKTRTSLFSLLESRVDAILTRTGFGINVFQVRQMILSGFFTVNGDVIRSPSYALKVGDVLSVHQDPSMNQEHLEKRFLFLRKLMYYQAHMKKDIKKGTRRPSIPKYLEVDYSSLSVTLISSPKSGEIFYPSEVNLKMLREFRT